MPLPRPILALGALLAAAPALAQTSPPDAYRQLGHAILKELVETNTTASSGNTTDAARKLAARFVAAGFPAADVMVIGPEDRNQNLVVRWRGRGARKPLLLLGHLDVVEARRADWSVDPFVLTEKDGYFYGRGTQDIKGDDAALVSALLRMKQEGVTPDRDVVLALTSGEEGGTGPDGKEVYVGAEWLVRNHRDLVDAEYALNVDAGGVELEHGKHTRYDVEAAEKVFHSVSVTARNPGGHSSLPRPDNAIYELAAALERLSRYQFPARTSDVTRAYFAGAAATASPARAAADMRRLARGATPDAAAAADLSTRSPLYNSILRTTCVATMLSGGHAVNALPQTASATVNCRMFPGDDPAWVEAQLRRVVADTGIAVTPIDTAKPSAPTKLQPEIMATVTRVARGMWGPQIVVLPFMDTGASDGLYLRNAGIPTYGVPGIAIADGDNRMHGRDERILISSFDDALEFQYRLVRALATATPST